METKSMQSKGTQSKGVHEEHRLSPRGSFKVLMQQFFPMRPPKITHQEHKVRVLRGKPIFYEPDDLREARMMLRRHLWRAKPEKPFSGPLECLVKWVFPFDDRHTSPQWRLNRPDCHNMNKLLFDVMTDLGIWEDDSLVCREIIEKFYDAKPGIFIRISQL